MNPAEREYDLIGELADDGRSLILHHMGPSMVRILTKNLQDKDGQPIKLEITVKPLRETRSEAQNRYLHGVIIPCIRQWFKDSQGESLTAAVVYAWIKSELLGFEPSIKHIMGTEVITFKEIKFSKLSTKDFADKVDLIIKKMLEISNGDCDIPTPRKQNHMHEFLTDEQKAEFE